MRQMMNYKRFLSCISLLLVVVLAFAEWQHPVSAQGGQVSSGPLAELRVDGGRLLWQPLVTADGWQLTITGPGGWAKSLSFGGSEVPALALQDAGGQPLADGAYQYELRPVIRGAAGSGPQGGDGRSAPAAAGSGLPIAAAQSGLFSVQGGAFALQSNVIEPQVENDVVNPDDLIVQGSLCVGFACVENESFGFDTVRLKEDNTRLTFDDASTLAGFPANDWTIVANDAPSGGASYLAFQDVTANRVPFKVMAGAPDNALLVNSNGDIGLGTSTPILDIHLVDRDTPAIRFDQDNTGGWAPQAWDVAGNEANFFIRDFTNGSLLPFRIRPGAPTSSIDIAASGNVGIGTAVPGYALEVERTGQDALIVAQRVGGASAVVSAGEQKVQVGALTNHNLELVVNNSAVMTLDAQGNATLNGVLYEHSDVNAKTGFQPVDRGSLLDRLETLPITTWSYQGDDPAARHMGPMAQDFYGAFGLGADDTRIAALDANGVTLAAAQELLARVKAQESQVAQLEAENQALKERLDALERLVSQALGRPAAGAETAIHAGSPSWRAR